MANSNVFGIVKDIKIYGKSAAKLLYKKNVQRLSRKRVELSSSKQVALYYKIQMKI